MNHYTLLIRPNNIITVPFLQVKKSTTFQVNTGIFYPRLSFVAEQLLHKLFINIFQFIFVVNCRK
jgi:hypothetical protein